MLVLLEYYLTSDYRGDGVLDRALDDYDVSGYPTVYFNGPQNRAGPESYDKYKARVDSERAKGASISITAEASVSEGVLAVQAEVHNNSDGPVNDLEAWIVAYEDLGESKTHHVLLDLERVGTFDILPGGGIESFSEDFDLSGSSMSTVEAAIFLQS